MNLVIKKVTRDWGPTPSEETVKYFEIDEPTADEAFARYFRECENRFRYCNDIHHIIVDDAKEAAYREWISDVNNYANNGGDMW